MIFVKIKDQKLTKALQRSITYAEEKAGKIVENILRNCISGESAENLSATQGVSQIALQNAPTQAKIEKDVRRLRAAFVIERGQKVKKRMYPQRMEELIAKRMQASGFTAKTLKYQNWKEARISRNAVVTSDLTGQHEIEIRTKGKQPRAIFRSTHGGAITMKNKYGAFQDAIASVKGKYKDYTKKTLTRDLREILK